MAHCADCKLPYCDPGFADLVVPDDVFNRLHDREKFGDGLLCPNCLVRRARNAGIENIRAKFTSGPFAADD
jgi:hypothetical protein